MSLLERSGFLETLSGFLLEASAGRGGLVFLGGEAGVGKTALVEAFRDTVPDTVQVAVGACDSLSAPRPLGPLADMADTLGLEGRLGPQTERTEVFQAILALLNTPASPRLLVFEDVHWADEATLDLLRFLGRRLGSTRALLIATYRDEEVGSQHPLRTVLGDLATSGAVRRMALTPLSQSAVRRLAEGSALDAERLHYQTGGNPFFVTEILAAGSETIPVTVRDAVLARVSRLAPAGRAVLEAASIVGTRV